MDFDYSEEGIVENEKEDYGDKEAQNKMFSNLAMQKKIQKYAMGGIAEMMDKKKKSCCVNMCNAIKAFFYFFKFYSTKDDWKKTAYEEMVKNGLGDD